MSYYLSEVLFPKTNLVQLPCSNNGVMFYLSWFFYRNKARIFLDCMNLEGESTMINDIYTYRCYLYIFIYVYLLMYMNIQLYMYTNMHVNISHSCQLLNHRYLSTYFMTSWSVPYICFSYAIYLTTLRLRVEIRFCDTSRYNLIKKTSSSYCTTFLVNKLQSKISQVENRIVRLCLKR